LYTVGSRKGRLPQEQTKEATAVTTEVTGFVMMTEVPGADAAFAEGMRQAGILDALQSARGFRGHWSGATSSGYRAIELWDSREDGQAFADANFAPNLPPGIELPSMEFFELNFEVKPAP
jgi:hypothetical protein